MAESFVPDKRYYYTKDELETLFRVIRAQGNLGNYTIFKLLFLMGRRLCEICGNLKLGTPGLYVRDIDFNSGLITFTIEKQGKWEKIILADGTETKRLRERSRIKIRAPPVVLDMLKSYISDQGLMEHDRLFPNSRQYYHQALSEYLEKAGILGKKRIVHALRHTFAITALGVANTGEDIRSIQRTLAHARLETTENYFKFLETHEENIQLKVSQAVEI